MKKELICSYYASLVIGIAICTFPAAHCASAAVNLGSSSWAWQNPLPQGNNLRGTTCSSAGGSLNCIAVGDLGTIIFGTASGGGAFKWTGQMSNTTQTLRAVACAPGNPNDCFAVGDGGTILATTNQGATWTSQSSGVTVVLAGISCRSTVNCFAVGGGWILATDDGGATWFGQPHPGGSEPIAVSCPDANTCYVAANNSGASPVILKTTNGGATWPATPIPGSAILTAISCGSTSHCVAADLDGNTYATTDGTKWGAAVPVVSTVARPNLYGVSCWDTENCVVVGAAAGSGNNLFLTNNNGLTWNSETSGADSTILSAVSCSTQLIPPIDRPRISCVAAGYFGDLITNYSTGSAYTNIRSTITNKRLTRVSCVDTNNCWVVGDGGIFATSNGGTTWTNQYSAGSLLGISCPAASICFAVGGNLVLGTTDSGKTWNNQLLGMNAILNAVSCPSATVCFAAGTSILATTDGGRTWVPQVIFHGYPGVSGIVCTSTTSCTAVGSGGGVFTTFDGRTWTQASPVTSNNLQDVSCASPSICIAVGDSGATLITTDGAKTWSLQPSSTTKYLVGIGCNLNLGCYATTQDGSILLTYFFVGAAWNPEAQQEGDLGGVNCAGVSGEYRCVAVGGGGTILSKQIGPSAPDFSLTLQPLFTGKTGVRGFNVVVSALGPFNGSVTLTCSIPNGQSCALNPASVLASGTSLMTGPTFLPDWDGVTVTGTSGSLKHTATFTESPPPYLPASQEPASESRPRDQEAGSRADPDNGPTLPFVEGLGPSC